MGDDNQFPELECGGDNLFAERSHVVLVPVPDLFDKTVCAEPLQKLIIRVRGTCGPQEFRPRSTTSFKRPP